MASLNYSHSISAKGVAEGLPVRRGSHLYDVEPMQRYPNVLSLGTTQASQFQYGKGVYFRTPHLPITFTIGPYVDNHNADGGNFTRDQHFVIKRGQPVMAASKRETAIGVFTGEGDNIENRTYVDPAKLATNGTIEGFFKPDRYQLKDTNNAGSDADKVITRAEYDGTGVEGSSGLPADDGTNTDDTPDKNDYKEVTEDDPVAVSRFAALSDEKQENYRAVYTGLEDTNDQIATGGTNLYAEVDEALFEETDMIKNVRVDADDFYFQSASQAQGFIFPSSGGAERTIFYNQVDQEAGVTLPTAGDADRPVAVQPIGSTSTLKASNINDWKDSASHVEALPTIGVMHTDLEQAKSQQHHRFSTGTEPRSVVRTGELNIPFIDIDKLKSIIDNKTDLTFGDDFNFVDQSGNQSGFKTGLYGVNAQSSATDLADVNLASLLTENDSGYAQLYYNLAAPFMVTKGFPSIQQGVKPDLFGNYVPADAARFTDTATTGSNALGISDDSDNKLSDNQGSVDMDALGLGGHVIGNIVEVYDMPRKTLEHLRVNPIFQSRITQGTTKNALNEGHRRLGGTADTGGADQLVADTAFMLLGGSNYDHFSKLLPQYEDIGQDLSNILEDMIIEGAIGRVEIAFNSVGR